MFAARRKERVEGRTVTLVVSTEAKKGLKNIGTPRGIRWARYCSGWKLKAEQTTANHAVRPKVKVNNRCLEELKV